jgi:MFS family permease
MFSLNTDKTTCSGIEGFLKRFAIDLSPLRQSRDFRLLYAGQFVSTFGIAISYVVLPWQMYALTKSTLYSGLLGIVEFVPMFVLSFFGGQLADTMDRRRLIIAAELGMIVCCGVLLLNALLPEPKVWVLFVGAGLFSALNALHRPAHEALTQQVVAVEQMPAVSALSSFRYSFNFIVGPALAGLLVATWGAAVGFAIDLATYMLSIATLLLIRSRVWEKKLPELSPIRGIREGLAYARRRPELIGTYAIDIIAMFFAMPVVLFPKISEMFGSSAMGLFYSAMAVGALLVSLTSGWTSRVHRHGRAIVFAVMVWGMAIMAFGAAQHLWLALFFLCVAGAADAVSGIFRMTIWNETIPHRLRGRMAGIEMISYLTGPYLGAAQAGFSAAAVGVRIAVVLGGALCTLGGAGLSVLLPTFYRYERRGRVAEKESD